MILEKFPEVQRLTVSEKLIFVPELWNDLEAQPSELPVSREIIEGLIFVFRACFENTESQMILR
jgi:hypothetical protein